MRKEDGRKWERARVVFQAFEKFIEEHSGGIPATIAAGWLRMTPQGLYQAAERGWIAYFQHGRNRIYSRRDVLRYRWHSRKFRDNRECPPYPPGGARVNPQNVDA